MSLHTQTPPNFSKGDIVKLYNICSKRIETFVAYRKEEDNWLFLEPAYGLTWGFIQHKWNKWHSYTLHSYTPINKQKE